MPKRFSMGNVVAKLIDAEREVMFLQGNGSQTSS